MMNNQWEKEDLIFFDAIREEIAKSYEGDPTDAFYTSSFMRLYKENPIFANHYDEEYWADFIIKEVDSKHQAN